MKLKKKLIIAVLALALGLSGAYIVFASIDNSQIADINTQNNTLEQSEPKIDADKRLLQATSPNGNSIAYLVKSANRAIQKFDDIYIEDVNTSKTLVTNLENIVYTSELELKWINNNFITFTGHINPSLDVHVVINANSGEIAKTYYGIGFTWDKNTAHVYYTLPQPFFSDVRGNDKIYEDDKVIYESNKNIEIFGGPTLNEEGSIIAFFEKDLDNNDVNLVVGEKKPDEKVKPVKKIKWNDGYGKITFNNDNTINIDTVYNKFKLNLDSEKIIHSQ